MNNLSTMTVHHELQQTRIQSTNIRLKICRRFCNLYFSHIPCLFIRSIVYILIDVVENLKLTCTNFPWNFYLFIFKPLGTLEKMLPCTFCLPLLLHIFFSSNFLEDKMTKLTGYY